ncbi:hypothetical protein [Lewinella sp. LCG006]|uniref:hypothetical protein n=1 Tax=Lewinella sp. LCG006 TaxID=3231911 RepID=UPI00345F60C2
MENSYLYQVVSSITTQEKSTLLAFLQSPYFNTGSTQEEIIRLFQVLQWPSPLPDKATIYEHVFPGKKFVTGKLDKLMTELNGLIRRFFLVERYSSENNTFQQALDFATILRERNLMTRYPQSIQTADKILAENYQESVTYFYYAFRLAYEKHTNESHNNRIKGDLDIPATLEHFDKYYVQQRLELLNLLLLQGKFTALAIPSHLTSVDFLTGLVPEDSKNVTLKLAESIYLQLVAEKPSSETMLLILNLLRENESTIDTEVLRDFYAYLRSICGMLVQNGERSFLQLLHEIQRENLRNGFLFYQGKLAPSTYMGVAKVAISVGETDWAFDFVENYKDQIFSEQDIEPFYFFNKSQCLFSIGKYEEALALLPETFTDLMYLLSCRRMELKLYYELDSPLLSYKIDAQKMYISRISRQLISQDARKLESNFINILLQLSQCPPHDTARIDKITARVEEKKLVAERDWLLEKLSQLRSKK